MEEGQGVHPFPSLHSDCPVRIPARASARIYRLEEFRKPDYPGDVPHCVMLRIDR